MTGKIKSVIENLEKNNMQAVFLEKKEEILPYVEKMLPKGAKIAAGGSQSVAECGVAQLIRSGEYRFFDRNKPGATAQELEDIFAGTYTSDYYFCSTNALTVSGELINVDGLSNRLSAILFGPKNVVMIVGVNKIVDDIDAGIERIRRVAAPKNCVRLGHETYCSKTGHCIACDNISAGSMVDGCKGDERICRNYLISGPQKIKDRIKIILCGEQLGY